MFCHLWIKERQRLNRGGKTYLYVLNEGKDCIEEKTHMDQSEGEDSIEAKLNNKRMIMGTLKFVS
jgi:hypothetical protein